MKTTKSQKSISLVMFFWRQGERSLDEAHKMLNIVSTMHGMAVYFVSDSVNGEVLFVVADRRIAREPLFPVGECDRNQFRTGVFAG